ncbi:MAG: hypothetical protein CM15mV92_400 [Caudoviricetes sp.]|nr:MAG: hypothetical protein CM15mV92_400 [Caudoviricetes sp.]
MTQSLAIMDTTVEQQKQWKTSSCSIKATRISAEQSAEAFSS